MEKYRCKESFTVDEYDDWEDEPIGMKIVDKDSIWTLDDFKYRFIDGEIRLENDNAEWLELSKEHFKKYFERCNMIHNLKIYPTYFADVKSGIKTFEIRRNDRNYKIGDVLNLCEYNTKAEITLAMRF